MTFGIGERAAQILLVEDNPGDVRLTMEAMKEAGSNNEVTVVGDGEAALRYLLREPPYVSSKRPDLILLDLNLPKKDGREVLAEIKANESFRRIPVVVLSTSTSDEDIHCTYDLHANCFVSKPDDFDTFIAVVKRIEDFWLSVATLP